MISRKYHDLGVQELVLPPFGGAARREMIKRLEEIARRWVEPAAALGWSRRVDICTRRALQRLYRVRAANQEGLSWDAYSLPPQI